MEKALFFSYPSIFIEYREFIGELIEREIVIGNVQHLLRFVVSREKGEVMKEEFERLGPHLSRMEWEKGVEEVRQVSDMRRLMLAVAEEFLGYDNADMGSLIVQELIRKGYTLTEA
jgi:hypothetical protein